MNLLKIFMPALFMSFTNDWDEADPADHTKFKVQPSHVRDVKVDLGERLAAYFYGFTAGETDTGIKSLKAMVQTTAPSTAVDSVWIYAKDVSSTAEWFIKDEAGNEMQLTAGGKINLDASALANDVFLKAVDSTGTGTIDLIKGNASNLPEIAAGCVVEGTADPASDYAVCTKTYVDDQVAAVVGVPTGVVAPWGGAIASPPSGWLICDGSTFSATTYPALAAALGDIWGTHSGDNYYLPDFTNRFPYGASEGSSAGNASVGSKNTRTLTGNDNSVTLTLPVDTNKADGGGSATSANANAMNPYLAVSFIIKT